MKKILLCLFFLPLTVLAQLAENFSDGDFSSNPVWNGITENFEINNSKQLHLNASEAGISYLSTQNSLLDSTEWQFWIKLSFSPSANNFTRVYLVSDNEDLTAPLNGYFLQFGEAGSNDAIELYRQNGVQLTSVCRGKDGEIANSFAVRIKVTRRGNGLWEIFSDSTGGMNFSRQAEGTDNLLINNVFFGIFCQYTSSNNTKFYFDDFIVRNIEVDTSPPGIATINAISPNQLDIYFNEAVEKISAENCVNYYAGTEAGNPFRAQLEGNLLIHLTFAYSFPEDKESNLTAKNIEDLAGNKMPETVKSFTWHRLKAFELVINEIMADPSPTVGLPEWEYLEIFNPSSFSVNLKNWTLSAGSSTFVFPEIAIDSQQFLIVADNDAQADFQTFGEFIGFSNFSLTNASSTIILRNIPGQIIHNICYTDDWYVNDTKNEGGWALEQVDPENPCGEAANWQASTDPAGGTPGRVNSVLANNPDSQSPELKNIIVCDSIHIQVFFNEPMDSLSTGNPFKYNIDNSIGQPLSALPVAPDFRSVILALQQPVQEKIPYTLTINDSISDCVGNVMKIMSNGLFAIPEAPSENDLVINEILFNPKDDGVDFVEIFNRSGKIIDLSGSTLSSFDSIAGTLESVCPVTKTSYPFFPEEYLVLTTNPEKIKEQYEKANPDAFLAMELFPPFNNDEGIVVLATGGREIIDKFNYSETMHYALLNSVDGISLERISPERKTNDVTNWHSASQKSGFATPGYQNSQFVSEMAYENAITLSPEIFSPDNDGYNDIVNIGYTFDKPGFTANITIYDANGRLVRYLIKNELLGTSGSFSWDGINEDGEKALIGIYIVYVEIFNLYGKVQHYKKATVLGGKI